MSGKNTATAAVECITTYFPYALIFTNRENVFVDIQSQRTRGYHKRKHNWCTEKYIDNRARKKEVEKCCTKGYLEFTRD
jgi:hypothetical protein